MKNVIIFTCSILFGLTAAAQDSESRQFLDNKQNFENMQACDKKDSLFDKSWSSLNAQGIGKIVDNRKVFACSSPDLDSVISITTNIDIGGDEKARHFVVHTWGLFSDHSYGDQDLHECEVNTGEVTCYALNVTRARMTLDELFYFESSADINTNPYEFKAKLTRKTDGRVLSVNCIFDKNYKEFN